MKKLNILFMAVAISFLLIACNNSSTTQSEETEPEETTLDSIEEDILNQIEEEEADSIENMEDPSENSGNQTNPDIIDVNIN